MTDVINETPAGRSRRTNRSARPSLEWAPVNWIGENKRFEVRWSYPDGVEHADVSQFAVGAEPVYGFSGYPEVSSDILDRQ